MGDPARAALADLAELSARALQHVRGQCLTNAIPPLIRCSRSRTAGRRQRCLLFLRWQVHARAPPRPSPTSPQADALASMEPATLDRLLASVEGDLRPALHAMSLAGWVAELGGSQAACYMPQAEGRTLASPTPCRHCPPCAGTCGAPWISCTTGKLRGRRRRAGKRCSAGCGQQTPPAWAHSLRPTTRLVPASGCCCWVATRVCLCSLYGSPQCWPGS